MRLTFRKSFEFDTVLSSSEKIFVGGQKFISMQKGATVCVILFTFVNVMQQC